MAQGHISLSLVDIITKPLDERRFCELHSELNVLDSRNLDLSIARILYVPLIVSIMSIIRFVAYFGAQVEECHP
jgi:hypothetical protein